MKPSKHEPNIAPALVVNTLPSNIPGNITVGTVQRLLDLTKQKEKLDQEAAEVMTRRDAVEQQIVAIIGTRVGVSGSRKVGARGPRGAIKNAIVQALRTVGAEGMATQRIADTIHVPRLDVERYIFSRSGKNAGIERVDKGIYRLKQQPDAVVPKKRNA